MPCPAMMEAGRVGELDRAEIVGRGAWDAQKARGHVPRSDEEIDAQQREMREGSAKRQEAIEQLQKESRRLWQAEPGPQS